MPATAVEEADLHVVDLEGDIDRARALQGLQEALAELDEDKREVFVLYELELLPLSEVAQAVSCNETTALYRLEAARKELRKALNRRALIGLANTRVAGGQR